MWSAQSGLTLWSGAVIQKPQRKTEKAQIPLSFANTAAVCPSDPSVMSRRTEIIVPTPCILCWDILVADSTCGPMARARKTAKSLRSPEHRTLCEMLLKSRRKAGLKQTDVAKRLGKPQSYVAKYEGGERRLDVVEFLQVSRAIGFDPSPFLKILQKSRELPTTHGTSVANRACLDLPGEPYGFRRYGNSSQNMHQ